LRGGLSELTHGGVREGTAVWGGMVMHAVVCAMCQVPSVGV